VAADFEFETLSREQQMAERAAAAAARAEADAAAVAAGATPGSLGSSGGRRGFTNPVARRGSLPGSGCVGTTAVVALLSERRMWVAHCGERPDSGRGGMCAAAHVAWSF
jgi:hypothetical protein